MNINKNQRYTCIKDDQPLDLVKTSTLLSEFDKRPEDCITIQYNKQDSTKNIVNARALSSLSQLLYPIPLYESQKQRQEKSLYSRTSTEDY